ncbi:MAG: cobalamin-dependent protein, partial [Planctomycetaceae bacterium]|nr:cobalamin-dependent protein [Planctomycetaceae bacterium]
MSTAATTLIPLTTPDAASLQGRSPQDTLNCLLIQPRFAMTNYWNFVAAAEAVGARTMAPPLGLMTVAALLPQHWNFNLVDLNVRELTDEEWRAADLVCVGGMIPQQLGILRIIRRARDDGKFVLVGGPDPTSQPDIYSEAGALVIGEGENTIPQWLAAFENGHPCGVFSAEQRPDVTTSPAPRFDLVDFSHYLHFGIQVSRGCPFNCEFCDIIELFGRIPRSKNVEQVLA